MEPKNVREQPESRPPRTPRKRFRVEKLEERIAPARGGKGTRNCDTGGCGGSGTSSGLSGSVSTIF